MEDLHCCPGPQLVQGLPHNHTLKTVDLFNNSLGLDGLKMSLQPFLQNVTNYQLTNTTKKVITAITTNNQNEGIPNKYACDIYKLDWHSTWLGQILSSSAKSLSCYRLPWNTTIVLGTLIIIMLLLGRLFLHQSWMCCSVNFVKQRLVQKEQHPNVGTWWMWCKNARWIYVQEITSTSVKWFMTNCCAEFKCKIMAHLHLCVEHVFLLLNPNVQIPTFDAVLLCPTSYLLNCLWEKNQSKEKTYWKII
jgi:hypothetical protein